MENVRGELRSTSYELFIGALSVLSIVNLILYFVLADVDTITVIIIIDSILSIIFLSDFLYRFFTSESKSEYFLHQMGWVDLLASIPSPQFKILRLFRIFRVYRLMKIYGAKRLVREFFANRGESALLTLTFIMILILEFGGLAMLYVESRAPDGNIKTAADAVWYVYVTITTVGYGDRYPVSNGGRFLGLLIMTLGVGLFGTITAFLANVFIDSGEEDSGPAMTEIMAQLEEIKALLVDQESSNGKLRARIEKLESGLDRNDRRER